MFSVLGDGFMGWWMLSVCIWQHFFRLKRLPRSYDCSALLLSHPILPSVKKVTSQKYHSHAFRPLDGSVDVLGFRLPVKRSFSLLMRLCRGSYGSGWAVERGYDAGGRGV